ncbi:MAG: SusC/RagA family TonB-linked outer membrane protein, partial [Gemmatimonadota bacterium]
MRVFRLALLSAFLVLAGPSWAAAQNTGTISGQVTNEGTGEPLAGVQMSVVGTNLGALTNQEGRYLIQNVPTGDRTVRAILIGYGEVTQQVSVTADGTAVADFTLGESAIALEGLVVTATGQMQRRREVGSTVSNINVEQVNLGPVQSFSQLIQGRAAGVNVLQSAGTSGTGARIRIRGSNSISLSNEPMLIVDGVQIDNSSQSMAFGIGGQSISRLNDINPEDIASIEVLKGPAASALYGTAAANGVIQITTKAGRAGPTQWNVYAEYGQIDDVTDYPANYQQLGTSAATGDEVWCPTISAAAGLCTPTETLSWNPLEEVPPFRTGVTRTQGASVTGGNDQVQYFISAENENEDGIYDSNSVDRKALRTNVDAQLYDNLDVGVNVGYTNSFLELPGNDNNTFGFIGAGLLGSAADNDFNRGYFAFPNEWRFALERTQTLHRFIGSADVNWRPMSWLTLNGTVGMDHMTRDDESAQEPGIWLPAYDADNAMGYVFLYQGLIRNYTARGNAIGTFELTDDIDATTTVGGEFREERFQRSDGGGYNMLAGTHGLGSLAERFSVDEFDQTTRTISVLGSQQFSWRDRVYLTGAVRGDRNSNFGSEFGFQWYPSVSGSWVMSEEEWFPQTDLLSSLRARAAWGRSGLMPGFRTAEQFYSATVATIGDASVPAITIGGAGNADLKPEQSEEWELGFDAGMWDDRIGL